MRFLTTPLRFLLVACALTTLWCCGPGTINRVNIAFGDRDASSVAPDGPITINFLFPIVTSTVTTSSAFIVTGPDASPSLIAGLISADTSVCDATEALSATVHCDSATRCVLTPAESLSLETHYTLCLTSDIQYQDEGRFGPFRNVAFSFTTVATHAVGGTLTGLDGTLVLQNNAGDDLTVSADGSFVFATEVAEGEAYSVSVLTQPAGQVCAIVNGAGTMGTTDVTDITVNCVAALGDTTLLDVSPSVQTGIYSSYNSQQDQFLLTWWNADEASVDFIIYNADGSIAVPDTLLFDGTITPLSDVSSCYNEHLNQYFVVWNEYNTSSAAFAILDSAGAVVTGVTVINGAHTPNGNVTCSYNSTDHQYFLSWVDAANEIFFAILNEDGTEAKAETAIPNVGGVSTGGPTVFSSYNSTTNDYFVSWTGSDFGVYFALYDASGTAIQTATVVQGPQGYNNGSNCYNSVDNQYFMTWHDTNSVTYFSIYDAAGASVTPPQEIPGFVSNYTYAPVYCSYNSVQNNYFVTATSAEDGADVLYALVSAQGAIEVGPATISTPGDLQIRKTVYSRFGSGSEKVLITWLADDLATIFNGYFVFYSFAP